MKLVCFANRDGRASANFCDGPYLTQATCTRIRFQKIRFRKDPFWGVHTYRTAIRRPRSHGCGLIKGALKKICTNSPVSVLWLLVQIFFNASLLILQGKCLSTASVFCMYVDREGLASSSNRTFLFVSFACQCRSSR